jgi:hypothetical protein
MKVDRTLSAMAMLGNNQLCHVLGIGLCGELSVPLIFCVVLILTIDEHDHISVLLNAATLTEV